MTIRDTIDFYKKHFQECWDEENYKWIAAKHFRENWDIDAENFADMLEESFRLSSNLLNGGMYYPYRLVPVVV